MEKLSRGGTLQGRAFELIRDEITSGRLAPGAIVSANTLAERFGVSRTPVREALLQLERAGMVRIEKNRGATVLATSLEDLLEVFQLRLLLEPPLAAQAARVRTASQLESIRGHFEDMEAAVDDSEALLVIDRDFHLEIARVSGNKRAVSALADLRNLVLTRGVGTTSSARTGDELVADHVDIVSGIERRDPEAAASAMARHIRNTACLLIGQESGGDERYGRDWVIERLSWLP